MTDRAPDIRRTARPRCRRGSGVKDDGLRRAPGRDPRPGARPGQPIDEVQIAERLGVSRTPVREALVRLLGDGLIETLPNRSTMVSNIDYLNLHFFDALILMYRVTAGLAAQHHRKEDLPRILDLAGAVRPAVGRETRSRLIGQRLLPIPAIAEAGRQSLFQRDFRPGARRGAGCCASTRYRPTTTGRRTADEHEAIIAAVIARDWGCGRLAVVPPRRNRSSRRSSASSPRRSTGLAAVILCMQRKMQYAAISKQQRRGLSGPDSARPKEMLDEGLDLRGTIPALMTLQG